MARVVRFELSQYLLKANQILIQTWWLHQNFPEFNLYN